MTQALLSSPAGPGPSVNLTEAIPASCHRIANASSARTDQHTRGPNTGVKGSSSGHQPLTTGFYPLVPRLSSRTPRPSVTSARLSPELREGTNLNRSNFRQNDGSYGPSMAAAIPRLRVPPTNRRLVVTCPQP